MRPGAFFAVKLLKIVSSKCNTLGKRDRRKAISQKGSRDKPKIAGDQTMKHWIIATRVLGRSISALALLALAGSVHAGIRRIDIGGVTVGAPSGEESTSGSIEYGSVTIQGKRPVLDIASFLNGGNLDDNEYTARKYRGTQRSVALRSGELFGIFNGYGNPDTTRQSMNTTLDYLANNYFPRNWAINLRHPASRAMVEMIQQGHDPDAVMRRFSDPSSVVRRALAQMHAGILGTIAFITDDMVTLAHTSSPQSPRGYLCTLQAEVIPGETGLLENDNFVILASHGLWSRVSPEQAAEIASRVLRQNNPQRLRAVAWDLTRAINELEPTRWAGPQPQINAQNRCHLAAAALVREAANRGNTDNICVIVFRKVPPPPLPVVGWDEGYDW